MGNARENPRISLMDHEVVGMLQRHLNDRKTLSKLKSTKRLSNIPNGLKGFRNIPNGSKLLRKLPCRLRSSTNSTVSHKIEKFPQESSGTPSWVQDTKKIPSRVVRKRVSLQPMSRDDTNSTMSHKREEEFSPGKLYTINKPHRRLKITKKAPS